MLLYNIIIRLYSFAVRIASIWKSKAKKWIRERRNLFQELQQKLSPNDDVIWFHCSSAGEFEQGKPVIEKLKQSYPSYKILVTFFSPSGFDVTKKYSNKYIISYLPVDTKHNAKRFMELVHPKLIVFVKYEFWYYHLSAASKHTPILLISAVFRKNQAFFKWYGKFYKQMLFLFTHIFVQDETSLQLLLNHEITHCTIGGDTRFDRVKEIADGSSEIEFVKDLIANKQTLVAGSTWDDDEKLLGEYASHRPDLKFIIAPHEINAKHIASMKSLFPEAVLYSNVLAKKQIPSDKQILIIDSVGLLSRLYKYATITYVGGGFTKDGIHNILEAAVFGKPVIFGSNYKKYREGIELIEKGGAFSISTANELKKIADDLLNNQEHLQSVRAISKKYVLDNTGATAKILQFIQEKRLLTN